MGRAAAEHIKPCTLELGGKSPVIVDKHVDLDKAVSLAHSALFINAGGSMNLETAGKQLLGQGWPTLKAAACGRSDVRRCPQMATADLLAGPASKACQ